MSSPTSGSFIDSPVSSHHSPQRLSQLYQYHNAPEVAPAAGLEYDENARPWSDKYPVVQASPFHKWTPGSSTHTAPGQEPVSHKPPLIIFGMKLRTFIVVFVIVVLVIIGASVGGALGRPKAATAEANPSTSTTLSPVGSSSSSATTTTTAASTTSTFTAPTPTYSVLNDCPSSNNTVYTASLGTSSSTFTPRFTKNCDIASPLTQSGAHTLSQAFVYSFSDCIDICASIDFFDAQGNNVTCNAAVFVPEAQRPANCYVGTTAGGVSVAGLAAQDGTNVALLDA